MGFCNDARCSHTKDDTCCFECEFYNEHYEPGEKCGYSEEEIYAHTRMQCSMYVHHRRDLD